MGLETKSDLRKETVEGLQKLIRYNIDSYKGFREAADEVEDQRLKSLFTAIAQERSDFATELQNFVEWNGQEAEDDGSVMAAMHRVWIDVRALFSDGDSYAILAEAERGEDEIKEAYEEVLKETAGSAMNDVLQAQYVNVKKQHDQIRDLRDAFKAAK
ncbi:PA2169 family four-helix-bundle protein [Thalassoroseus pseudoceratinae]|uniref:PA2169 family four-helix-bundle protein n=1 Tax=Thalassoroseus pseudoceratinae TaxID=2713176 RepID=UPI0014229FED|nr:PA2169 family four-helix-bundle protein [Thalassoroseus pseudoceratinae]